MFRILCQFLVDFSEAILLIQKLSIVFFTNKKVLMYHIANLFDPNNWVLESRNLDFYASKNRNMQIFSEKKSIKTHTLFS